MRKVEYDGSSDVGVYCMITNTYALIGPTSSLEIESAIREASSTIPIIYTTINSIRAVGRSVRGNKNGLLLPFTVTDQEMQYIRQSLPDRVKVKRIEEKLNALGNTLLCNDYFALVHPDIDAESVEEVENILGVEAHRGEIGTEKLVGSFGTMNNQGLLVGPNTSIECQKSLSELFGTQVAAGTVNMGNSCIGAGIAVNDSMGLCGRKTTNHEISVMDKVFLLGGK